MTLLIATSFSVCILQAVVSLAKLYLYCKQFTEARMNKPIRSGCPINLTLEKLGDRWSLIVIRDIMFGNRRHYRDLLNNSEEGIASNILADRLKKLVDAGLLSTSPDTAHKQKTIYSLTEPAIQLVPLLAQMGAWGRRFTPVTRELSIRAQLLEEGGPEMWEAFMAELRSLHLGAKQPATLGDWGIDQGLSGGIGRMIGIGLPAGSQDGSQKKFSCAVRSRRAGVIQIGTAISSAGCLIPRPSPATLPACPLWPAPAGRKRSQPRGHAC
jgi:DNA-binding HxlR family transcriptional regulator